jgi:polyribonucleotide 5'-hydroxyl-kinase
VSYRDTVDVVVVIGHEKLTIEMQKLLSGYGVSVISAPKSSGVSSSPSDLCETYDSIVWFLKVVDLDDLYRSRIRAQQIKTYFYGEAALPPTLVNLPGRVAAVETGLHPYSFTIPWDELEIYRVGEGTKRIAGPSRNNADQA